MTKKIIIGILGTLLLIGIVSAIPYGTILTQARYDLLTFDEQSFNSSYIRGNNGNIRMSCNGITGLCQALLEWDMWKEELENISTYDMETQENYTWFNPTGDYIYVRESKIIDINYLNYRRALAISPTLANRYIEAEYKKKQKAVIKRLLDHHEVRQTSQTIIINS